MADLYKVMDHEGHEHVNLDQNTVREWYLAGRVDRETLVFVQFRQQWARLGDVFDVGRWERPITVPVPSGGRESAPAIPSLARGEPRAEEKTTPQGQEQSSSANVEGEPSATTSQPPGSGLRPTAQATVTRNPALVAAGWLLIAFSLARTLFTSVAPPGPDALSGALAALVWDLINGAGLVRQHGLLKIRPNGWRILAIIRLLLGAVHLASSGAGKLHYVTDLQLLQDAPQLLALVCLLAFRPQSRRLIGACVSVWAITPIVLGLQVAGFRPSVRVMREAQVRDVALERRDFSDPDSGLKITAPSGWYFLPNKNPILNAPNARVVIAYPRAALVGLVVTDFLSGKELTNDREPMEQYLDKLLARQKQLCPDTRLIGSEAMMGLALPARRMVVTATENGRELIGFFTAFDDGYNFHLLSVSCPRAEQWRASMALAELDADVVFTKTREDRERGVAAILANSLPFFTREAYEAWARVVFKHRMSLEEAKEFGRELAKRTDSYLPAEEARESVAIVSQALLALPEKDLRTLRECSEKYRAGGKLTPVEIEKVYSLTLASLQNLPSHVKERQKYLFSKGFILGLANQ